MSLAVVASASVVALGFSRGDPIIGLVITLVILGITWQSFQTIRHDPGDHHLANLNQKQPANLPIS